MKKIKLTIFLTLLVLPTSFVFAFNNKEIVTDSVFKTARIDCETPNGYMSQILLGFMNDLATDGIDPGYDAVCPNNFANQFYFKVQDLNLIIQGVGYFDAYKVFPIGIKTDLNGIVKFNLNSVVGFQNPQPVYIYDNVTNTFHNIDNAIFQIYLNQGTHEGRFYLTFRNTNIQINALNSDTFKRDGFDFFVDKNKVLNIISQEAITKIEIYNVASQKVKDFTVNNSTINLDTNLNEGIYFAHILTNKTQIKRKFVIQ